jgi:hypothetical protein
VPVPTATACAAPVAAHSPASKRSTAGPVVNQGERSASTTDAMEASSTHWLP